MKQLLTKQQEQAILSALHEAANSTVWQKSNFLRVIGKQLHGIYDSFNTMIRPTHSTLQETTIDQTAEGHVEIFIYLYSSKGLDFNTWEHILVNLPRQLVSRAIYANEQQVKTWIRSKLNPNNEAYLRVTVAERFILALPENKTPCDKLQQPLLTIRGYPLQDHYKGTFVHITGEYDYASGHLTKK